MTMRTTADSAIINDNRTVFLTPAEKHDADRKIAELLGIRMPDETRSKRYSVASRMPQEDIDKAIKIAINKALKRKKEYDRRYREKTKTLVKKTNEEILQERKDRKNAQRRERRKTDPAYAEKCREAVRRWYEKDPEKKNAKAREWKEKNKEAVKKQRAIYRQENREKENAYRRELRKRNAEKERAYQLAYRERNRKKLSEAARVRRAANIEVERAKERARYHKNKLKAKEGKK